MISKFTQLSSALFPERNAFAFILLQDYDNTGWYLCAKGDKANKSNLITKGDKANIFTKATIVNKVAKYDFTTKSTKSMKSAKVNSSYKSIISRLKLSITYIILIIIITLIIE